MKPSLVIGMVGHQFMGRAHSNGWRQLNRFFNLPVKIRLKSIAGLYEDQVKAAAESLGWEHGTTDWASIMADPEIQVIDVVTPNDTHEEIALAAIKAGKHVLCEKPLSSTLEGARKMRDAAAKSNKIAAVCHNYRAVPAIMLAKKMIDEGTLGKIYHLRARYLQDWIVDPEFPLVWRLRKEIAGSGCLGDIHSHILDLSRFLVGEFKEVCGMMETLVPERPLPVESDGLKAKGSRQMGKVTVDDVAFNLGRFENGAVAVLESSRMSPGRKNFIEVEVSGSKGTIAFNFEDMNRLKYYNTEDPADRQGFRDILVTNPEHAGAKEWWPPGHIIGYEHTFTNFLKLFVEAITQGKPFTPNFEDGYRNQQLLEAIEKSANSRQWVEPKNI